MSCGMPFHVVQMTSSLPSGPLTICGRPPGLDHLRVAQHLAVDEVDLGHGARELAGEDRVAAVDREVGVVDAGAAAARRASTAAPSSADRGSRAACIASATTIADLPSGEKYMLYGSSTAIGLPGLPVLGSIGVRLPSVRVLGVVGDPQRAQVPRRHDVLRVEADLELVDDLERRRIDHVDVVRLQVAARRRAAGRRRPRRSACRRSSRCRGWPDRRTGGMPGHRRDRRRGAAAAGACAGACASTARARRGERRRQATATSATMRGFTNAPESVQMADMRGQPCGMRRQRRATACRIAVDRLRRRSHPRPIARARRWRGADRRRRRRRGRGFAPDCSRSVADEPGIDRQRERRVGEPGVGADLVVAVAAALAAPARYAVVGRRGSTRRSRARGPAWPPIRGSAGRRRPAGLFW